MEDQNVIEVKPSYASEVHRALIALGFSEAERSKAIDLDCVPIALRTFSSWIDQVQALPNANEELRATWTEFMCARFGGNEPPMTPTAVNEAAHAAHYAITMQLQLFPPRARTVVGIDLGVEAWAELQEWREAAKQRGWDSPLSMRGHTALDDGLPENWSHLQWKELTAWRTAGLANGFDSPGDLLSVKDANLKKFADERIVKEWQEATGRASPSDAEEHINGLHGTIQRNHSDWKRKTGCNTALDAGELIKSFRAANVDLQLRFDELSAKFREQAWIDATGRECPGDAEQRIEDLEHELSKRNQDLLTANAEIDRVKKAAQTLGLVSDKSAELAKVRAELQSKQRECQTEKERADSEFKRRVDAEKYLHDIESAQFEFTHIRPGYARLAEELTTSWKQAELRCATLSGSLRKEEQRASSSESMLRIEQQKHDDTKKELLAANQKLASAVIPLQKPEKVEAGQKWAFIATTEKVAGATEAEYTRLPFIGLLHKRHMMASESGWLFLGP